MTNKIPTHMSAGIDYQYPLHGRGASLALNQLGIVPAKKARGFEMNTIYDQHQTTFRSTSAYVVLDKSGSLVARVAFKHGAAVTCYFHILGQQMAKGRACGGGYDRASAAAYNATRKILAMSAPVGAMENLGQVVADISTALNDDGEHWDRAIEKAGYSVIQAV